MKKDILYENHILRNTNYYLLCTIYNLEKQKVNHLNNIIKESEEPDKLRNDNSVEINELIKEKEDEYTILKTELENLKIEMEMQKEFSTHKIENLENIKNILEYELLDIKKEYSIAIPISEPDPEEPEQEQDIIKKDKEIEKLKRDNSMLMINNQQLQFELIRTIKFM